MCDISKQTTFKTKTVYKVCAKYQNNYYSIFSAKKLTLGAVSALTEQEVKFAKNIWPSSSAEIYLRAQNVFGVWNDLMVGKVSGFRSIKDALLLYEDSSPSKEDNGTLVILKVKLGGKILKGTTHGINWVLKEDHTTYAGTVILSMEEVSL